MGPGIREDRPCSAEVVAMSPAEGYYVRCPPDYWYCCISIVVQYIGGRRAKPSDAYGNGGIIVILMLLMLLVSVVFVNIWVVLWRIPFFWGVP